MLRYWRQCNETQQCILWRRAMLRYWRPCNETKRRTFRLLKKKKCKEKYKVLLTGEVKRGSPFLPPLFLSKNGLSTRGNQTDNKLVDRIWTEEIVKSAEALWQHSKNILEQSTISHFRKTLAYEPRFPLSARFWSETSIFWVKSPDNWALREELNVFLLRKNVCLKLRLSPHALSWFDTAIF